MTKSVTVLSQSEELETERRTVSFDVYDMTVRQILDLIDTKNIDISPEYQRHFVWDAARESAFIESVFLGIPIPSLFMATNSDGTWEVVDGVQRISTLIHFCGKPELFSRINKTSPLILSNLEKLPSFNGVAFNALPQSIQIKFTLRSIRITTLNDKSDTKVRFDLFERLNTGGVSLQPQEIRNCIYRGPFSKLLKVFSGDKNFQKSIRLKSKDQHNGTKEDLVLRFFAFLEKYKEFNHSVNDFLNDYMAYAEVRLPKKEAQELFKKVFEFIVEELPEGIVRGVGPGVTPVNLYEAIAVGTALAFRVQANPKKNVLKKLLNHRDLQKFTTAGTNSRARVAGRIEFVRDRLV